MFPSRASLASTFFRTGLTVAAVLLLFAGAAAAQPTPECLEALEPLLEESLNCTGHPTIPKYFDTSTFLWGGRTQLAVNDGNELHLWDISDATNPDEGDFSAFPVLNQGDSDYDLLNHSICDECRWGVATFKLANVIFDLGTNPSRPDFTTQRVYDSGEAPQGAFMFKIGSQEYLLANYLPGDCGGDATLYKVNGVEENDLQQIGCVDVPGFDGNIYNGAQLYKNGTHYLYLGMGNRQIYVYEVQEIGGTINLQFASQPANFKAFLSRGKGLSIDKTAELAVTALSNDGFRIWDISNPAAPVQRAHVPASAANVNTAAIRYPFVWVGRTLQEDTSKTYNIEVPTNPVVMDQNFWHPDQPWNSHSEECEWPQGASFSDDGNVLYFARYAVVQMIDFTACGGPVQPTANMNIAPSPAFPADDVTVTDTSFGSVEETAIWITPSSNPEGTVLAGSVSYGGPSPLGYTIARTINADQERWAHMAVQNEDFPCDPLGSCPAQQLKSQEISIDREPQASVDVDPPNPITNTAVDLFGDFEGAAGTVDPFEWKIFRDELTNPDPIATFTTQNVTGFTLEESGEYRFQFKVRYDHEASEGVLYEDKDSVILDVSSVAADFTVPSNPLNTDPITLDGTASNWSPGATLSWNWSVTGPTNYGGCPNASTCTIPAEALSPGSYTVSLTLTNTNNGDQSTADKPMNVSDGSIQLDLDISDSTPDIGQQVFFDITGVPGDVDQASWNYGGAGCPDFPQFVTCNTPPYCNTGIHKYASAGTKTVTLSVVIDGNTFGPISRNLTVNSTGDCGGGGGGGGTCTYSIMPDDAEFDASGGTGAVLVSTQSGCPWTAVSQAGWIDITNGNSGSGNGTVSFSVDPNPNSSERVGTLLIAGQTFTVTQFASVPTNFSISNSSPDIGEEVIFAVASGLIPESWDFQSPDCGWNPPTVDCSSNPSACESFVRTFAQAGLFDVTLETTTGTKTRTVWVRNQGNCEGVCTADGPPDPSFTVTPNPVQGGQVVEFFHSEETVVVECEYVVDPESVTISQSGGGGSITVATHPDCAWFASDDRAWISITGEPLMGTGPAIVNFQVDTNNDGAPRMGHVFVGGQVVAINQESTGGAGAGDGGGNGAAPLPVGITVSNQNPQIGEVVEFDITGYGGDVEAHWDFGGTGCSPFNQIDTCYPTYTSCLETTFKYASAGPKNASVTVYNPDNGVEIGSANITLTVQATGTCGGCVYSISPSTGDFPIAGGTGTINVTTGATCDWNADPSHNWITILSGGSGPGNGTIQYSVATNTGPARQGDIQVVNRLHTINQEGTGGGGGGGGGGGTDEATEWLWTVSLDGDPVLTSTDPNFTHVFGVAGLYVVELEAGNCKGSATSSQVLQVTAPPPPDDFLVPAAAHAPGLYDTVWRTDLRILNPCSSAVDVSITYLPEGTNNNGGLTYGLHFSLAQNATRIFDDIVDQIPGIEGDDNKGSLRFTFEGGQGCTPMIVSRTYNDTPEGTFGQFVPAVPVLPLVEDRIFLTGLVHDFYYRTNIGLANFGEDDVGGIVVTVYDEDGAPLGEPIETWVPGYSTRQIVEVIERAGINHDVNIFTATIDTNGADLTTYASVIDNLTGDPVLYTEGDTANTTVWIPGVAHLPGANDSLWRSDLTFFNHTDDLLSARIDFVPEIAQGDDYFVDVHGMQPGATFYFVDVLDTIVPGLDTKGYFVVKGLEGSVVPEFVAKTYNLAPEGGTFGQNLKVFGETDLIHMGESAYIPGIGNSPDPSLGFRTNVGVLNTNEQQTSVISIKVYDVHGALITEVPAVTLAPSKFLQSNLFDALGIGDMDGAASVEIGVVSGGPVAAYASEIDNRTQDPILVPAVPMETPQ